MERIEKLIEKLKTAKTKEERETIKKQIDFLKTNKIVRK